MVVWEATRTQILAIARDARGHAQDVIGIRSASRAMTRFSGPPCIVKTYYVVIIIITIMMGLAYRSTQA